MELPDCRSCEANDWRRKGVVYRDTEFQCLDVEYECQSCGSWRLQTEPMGLDRFGGRPVKSEDEPPRSES